MRLVIFLLIIVFQQRKQFYHLYDLNKQGIIELPYISGIRKNVIHSIENYI